MLPVSAISRPLLGGGHSSRSVGRTFRVQNYCFFAIYANKSVKILLIDGNIAAIVVVCIDVVDVDVRNMQWLSISSLSAFIEFEILCLFENCLICVLAWCFRRIFIFSERENDFNL